MSDLVVLPAPRKIALSRGLFALVDEADFDLVSRHKWHAHDGYDGKVYAATWDGMKDGKRVRILMHRLIARTPDGLDTDHRDGDGLNNQRYNLRPATRAQNMWNRKPNKKGSSKHKGVGWHKQHQKWVASIQVSKVRSHLGLFDNEEDAAAAYQKRAAIEFGKYNHRS